MGAVDTVRPLLTLDDPDTTDPRQVGAKAALLARARAAGLPVLPGIVVPVGCGAPTRRAGQQALETGGSGRARLAAMQVAVDPELLSAVERAASRLGTPLIVRSSGVEEGNATWAGAFSSFADITVPDLSTALRGVWASAFTPQGLARAADAGAPTGAELAVLVQPQVSPTCSGTARVGPSGIVDLVASTGSVAGLLQGWDRGIRARIAADGEVAGDEARDRLGSPLLLAVADLARRVQQTQDCDLIEWGQVAGRPLLLQVSDAPSPPPRPAVPVIAGLDHPLALRVARAAVRAPGALGEAAVLPWGLGCARLPEATPAVTTRTPREDLAALLALAADLTAETWQRPPADAAGQAAAVLRELRGPAPGPALDRLATLRPADPARAAKVLGLIDGLIATAAERTSLADGHAVWSLEVHEIVRLLESGVVPPRVTPALGPDRWEPFVHAAVTAHGQRGTGDAAAPGIGAGAVLAVRDPYAPADPGRRPVVVTRWPVPVLAPLLWSAAALVTTAGNAGAHLIEVASSLGVPAVVQTDLAAAGWSPRGRSEPADRPLLAAVDGDRGIVSIADA